MVFQVELQTGVERPTFELDHTERVQFPQGKAPGSSRWRRLTAYDRLDLAPHIPLIIELCRRQQIP